jgi:hypothetical protein
MDNEIHLYLQPLDIDVNTWRGPEMLKQLIDIFMIEIDGELVGYI